MKKIEGFDIIDALGEVDARLLEYPSAARYRAKRIGIFSAAAMLTISVIAVIAFYATLVFSGAHAEDPNAGSEGSSMGGDAGDINDGSTGGSAPDDTAEGEIRISKEGYLLNFGTEGGRLLKGSDGSVTFTVALGDGISAPAAHVHYKGTGAKIEILTPEIKDGLAVFKTNGTPESINIFSDSFSSPVKLIFTENENFITFIYKNQ